MKLGRLARGVHRVHRLFGAVMALLVCAWCASGVVMMFVGYPALHTDEVLRRSAPLVVSKSDDYPEILSKFLRAGEFAAGGKLHLDMREGAATWSFSGANGQMNARKADRQRPATPVDAQRARTIAAEFVGARATRSERILRADQWTVSSVAPGEFPLWRVVVDDADGSEIYVAVNSAAVVQHTRRTERIYAWLGAIPHWIYPALLRRDRVRWRSTVLVLAGLGLAASLSGVYVGLHVWRRRRGAAIRERYLRAHHWLGLLFGGFVCTWLFSGALSLAPFRWTRLSESASGISPALHAAPTLPPELPPLYTLVQRCGAFDRAIQLGSFAGGLYAVCSDPHGDKRALDLADVQGRGDQAHFLPLARFEALAKRIAGERVRSVELRYQEDEYYYRSHNSASFVLPYVHIALADADDTALYLDARDGTLLRLFTRRARLERWLYHGLHSFDFPWLYARPWCWYPSVLVLLAGSWLLAALGAFMAARRLRRRLRARQRQRLLER